MIMGSSSSHDDDSDMYSDVEEEEDYDDDVYERENDFYISRTESEMSVEEVENYNPHIEAGNALCEVIPTRVADLKDIASLTVAIALYKHVDIPTAMSAAALKRSNASNCLESSIYDSVIESTKELPAPNSPNAPKLPKPLVEHINSNVRKMRKQIKNWVLYNYRKVFFRNNEDYYGYNHIEHLVWYSNGTINSRETARSLLTSLRLTELEKFYLLCTYCMKEDFKSLSPLFQTHNVVDKLDFNKYPLINYWNLFFRNHLSKIPVGGPGSIEVIMIQHGGVDNWPAKEYFFDRLTPDEQVRTAIWLIDKYGSVYMKLILMKLDEPQRLHLFMDRAVKIMTIYINSKSSFEEILSTWYETRNLMNKTQFLTVFNLVLNVEYDDAVLEAIWTSSCAEYRDHFLNGTDQFENFGKMLRIWTSNYEKDFFFTIMRDANKSLKANIIEKQFFKDACKKLICVDELLQLDRLLKSCFSDTQKIAKFKESLTQQDYFADHYLSLVIENESIKLKELLNSFFPDPKEESRFKQEIVKNACFLQRLQRSVSDCEFARIELLLNLFPADSEEMLKFKSNFVKEPFFICLCESFLMDDKLTLLGQIFEIFFPQAQDIVTFKKVLSARECVERYCEKLTYNNQDQTLQKFLNWLFTNAEEVAKFKRDFVVNSNAIRTRCLRLYAIGKLNSINVLLNQFLSPYPGILTEYKKNFVMSSMLTSVDFFEKSPEIFNKMVAEGFLPVGAVIEIKKTIIFSPSAVERMQSMILEGRLDRVKERFKQFLTSDEDRKTLKTVVIGRSEDLIQMIPSFFSKHNQSMWQSLMMWWLGNENMVQEFKRTLPVDDLFDTMLNRCVFEVFDVKSLRLCRFKPVIVFDRLDRFLLWIFETTQKAKEYKMKRVDFYMSIDTIRMLLKKKDDSYIKTVLQWFFEGDQQEITRFKNQNRGRKIIKLM